MGLMTLKPTTWKDFQQKVSLKVYHEISSNGTLGEEILCKAFWKTIIFQIPCQTLGVYFRNVDSLGFLYFAKVLMIPFANLRCSLYLLSQWLTGFKLLGIPYDSIFRRENKPFKLFFQGPGRLSEFRTF